ncbi:MAG: M20/M25/M40 family metallo-hydrolase, partial [candidate division Zixibacteria bacterium]|nr:M20/M25/M40 family metallo-hydrolase [candidate division Zixibacteria bacterium]
MRKCLIIIAIIACCTLSAQVYAADAVKDLVSIERSKISDVKKECEVRIIAKMDERAIGLLKSGSYRELRKADNSATLIKSDSDVSNLWIETNTGASSSPTKPLYQTERNKLFELTYKEAQAMRATGRILVKCFDINLPADRYFEVPRNIRPSGLLLDDIDSLMNLVSADSIETYLQRLQDFQTRYTCTDSVWAAGEWIANKFVSWGIDSVASDEFWAPFPNCTTRNIVATKFGVAQPDNVIVLGGHYDSVVYDGGDPWVFAPGVDDNGTGTVLAMELARVLANTPFQKTVRFIAFGAEEQGLYGSEYYVEQALQRGENIEVMFNADMIGNVSDDYMDFYVICNPGGVVYGDLLADIVEQYTYLIPFVYVSDGGGSDHYYFSQAGFRTVFSQEGDFSPHWHMQTDIIDNIDISYATEVIRANLGALLIAQALPSPVTGLQAFNAGDGETVYLEWDEHPDNNVIGYELLFGTSENDMNVYDTSFTTADTAFGLNTGTTYYFAVSGFRANGDISLIDEIVQITPQSIPIAPDTLFVNPEIDQLLIRWTESPDYDFDYYQLYRKVGDDGDYVAYQQLSGDHEFLDTGLESDTRYYYYVTVFDTTAIESEPSVEDYGKIISLDSGILLVDETRDIGNPNQSQQIEFFNFISRGYHVTFYDVEVDGLIRFNDMGPYSSIIWIDDDPSVQFLSDIDSNLAKYFDVGGNILFAGWRAFYSYGTSRPWDFDDSDFPYEYLGINSVNSDANYDFAGADGRNDWPDLEIDTTRVLFESYLGWIDIFDVRNENDVIYTFNSISGNPTYDGEPVGINTHDDNSNIIFLSFPLYPVGDEPAREVFIRAMNIFNEQTGLEDDQQEASIPSVFALSQNHPNPFNTSTKICYSLPVTSDVIIEVYNILGQRVTTLVDEHQTAGYKSITWDASGFSSGL